MKDIISIRIPSICICFTLVTVANSALNLLHSGGTDMYAVSILLIFVWLVLCQLIDAIQPFWFVSLRLSFSKAPNVLSL